MPKRESPEVLQLWVTYAGVETSLRGMQPWVTHGRSGSSMRDCGLWRNPDWQKQGELEEHTKKNLIVEINLCVYDPSLLHNILLHQNAGTE